VVLRALNPDVGPADHADLQYPGYPEDCRKLLTFDADPPFSHLSDRYISADGELALTCGARWWRRVTWRLAKAVGGFELFSEHLLCLEYLGYHSKTYTPLPGVLPSQEFTFGLLRQQIASDHLVIV
jgi:hypothetical protein